MTILREHGKIGHGFGDAGLAHDIRLACFGIDQYELVYQGSTEGLTNTQHIILAREKTATKMREDSYARTYLFVDGHSEILNAPTADGFDAREKQLNHVAGP